VAVYECSGLFSLIFTTADSNVAQNVSGSVDYLALSCVTAIWFVGGESSDIAGDRAEAADAA